MYLMHRHGGHVVLEPVDCMKLVAHGDDGQLIEVSTAHGKVEVRSISDRLLVLPGASNTAELEVDTRGHPKPKNAFGHISQQQRVQKSAARVQVESVYRCANELDHLAAELRRSSALVRTVAERREFAGRLASIAEQLVRGPE